MVTPCPICNGQFDQDQKYGYIVNGERVSTCKICHETLMQITLEAQLGQRKSFWKARSTEAIRKQVCQAVLDARGLTR